MPPFLGRYFGITSMVLLFVSLIYILREGRINLRHINILAFVISAVAFSRAVIGLASLPYADNEHPAAQIFLGLIIYYSLIPVGLLILASAERNRISLICSHVFIFLMIILNSASGQFHLASSGDLATHQTFSVVIVLLCIAFALVNSPPVSLIVISASTISLFFIGARSEMLILAILLLVACGFLATTFRGLTILAAVLAGLACVLIVSPVDFKAFAVVFEYNRFFDLLENWTDAGSMVARAEINSGTLVDLSRAPILGNFAGYDSGHYAHNMLSVWIDFGILGLVLHVLVFLVAAYTILGIKTHAWEKSILFSALGGVFVLEVFAKTYTYQLTALILGMIIGCKGKVRNTNLSFLAGEMR